MASITLDTPLRELMLLDSSVLDVLQEYGLGCASCLGAQFETLRDACSAHDLDGTELLGALNRALASRDTGNGDIHG